MSHHTLVEQWSCEGAAAGKAETVGTQPERTANTGCERLTSSKIYKKKNPALSPLLLCVSKTVPSQQAPTSDKQ